MPHVVTQACCGDASCVYACPVNCIHPTPDEADFSTSEMVYIDPLSCVDCGACVTACPVGAIVPHTKLTEEQLPFADLNQMFYAKGRTYPVQAPVPSTVKISEGLPALRVAIVGAGPAALYAADELLKQRGVEVNVFDRLPTPYGLVRSGVAPDHEHTKSVVDLFRKIESQRGFEYLLNVDVGRDISHDELLQHHHAVVYATGASRDRELGIPGEELSGSVTATNFVAWYNGHPDHRDDIFDLSSERAVIIGNGNVALDVARILTSAPEMLARTDLPAYALEALRHSKVREVVVVGRRGVAQAAFTLPELMGLMNHADVDLVVNPAELALDPQTSALRASDGLDPSLLRKLELMEEIAARPSRAADKRIVLRFLNSPDEILGSESVTGVRLIRNELKVDADGFLRAVPTAEIEVLQTSFLLRSIGYRGVPVADLPFDHQAAVIPNEAGRVSPRTYAVGWIKRGPTGFIGTNKTDARETVSNLLVDFNRGEFGHPASGQKELFGLLAERGTEVVDLRGWRAIDAAERSRGRAEGKIREKFTIPRDMLDLSRKKRGSSRTLAPLSR